MVPTVDKDPVGRHGAVVSRDLLPLTPDQEQLRKLVDNLGQRSVEQTVIIEQPDAS